MDACNIAYWPSPEITLISAHQLWMPQEVIVARKDPGYLSWITGEDLWVWGKKGQWSFPPCIQGKPREISQSVKQKEWQQKNRLGTYKPSSYSGTFVYFYNVQWRPIGNCSAILLLKNGPTKVTFYGNGIRFHDLSSAVECRKRKRTQWPHGHHERIPAILVGSLVRSTDTWWHTEFLGVKESFPRNDLQLVNRCGEKAIEQDWPWWNPTGPLPPQQQR